MPKKQIKMGAPVKYTPNFIKSLADKLLIYVQTEEIPYLKHFCFLNGFGSQRISEFEKVSPDFSEALNRFKDLFEAKIVIGSISGKFQGYMAMNTLKNCCGWRDKTEIEHGITEEAAELLNKYESTDLSGFRKRINLAVGQEN